MNRKFFVLSAALGLALGVLGNVTELAAAPLTISSGPVENPMDTSGEDLEASAKFEIVGGNLVVTLTNTEGSTYNNSNQLKPNQVLLGVFFDRYAPGALTPVLDSAVPGPGSAAFNGSSAFSGNLGKGWSYFYNFAGFNSTQGTVVQTDAIIAAGYGIGTGEGNFATPGENRGGVDYGITPLAYTPGSGQGTVGSSILVRNSMQFTLGAVPAGFDPLYNIISVRFQWGTNLSEGTVDVVNPDNDPTGGGVVPEPSTFVLAGLACLGLVIGRRKLAAR